MTIDCSAKLCESSSIGPICCNFKRGLLAPIVNMEAVVEPSRMVVGPNPQQVVTSKLLTSPFADTLQQSVTKSPCCLNGTLCWVGLVMSRWCILHLRLLLQSSPGCLDRFDQLLHGGFTISFENHVLIVPGKGSHSSNTSLQAKSTFPRNRHAKDSFCPTVHTHQVLQHLTLMLVTSTSAGEHVVQGYRRNWCFPTFMSFTVPAPRSHTFFTPTFEG